MTKNNFAVFNKVADMMILWSNSWVIYSFSVQVIGFKQNPKLLRLNLTAFSFLAKREIGIIIDLSS
jgi:hypothetical protein